MPDDTVNDPPKVVSAPIVYRHEWNSHLLSIRIARDPGYRFTPGQFARIGLADGNGETTWRAYSIVSAPHEPFLEFFLVVLPGGKFSARVAKLAIGEEILLEKPAQGFLTLDRFRDGADLWLIGTGTGLAPYVSMLREPSTWKRFQNIVIALSVREAQDLAYVDEIETLAASHTAGESGELEANAELAFDLDRSRFMLCGNPEMVEAMRAILKARGFAMNRRLTPGHIIVENYW
jgi:ferredoxin--NADP+ reductase